MHYYALISLAMTFISSRYSDYDQKHKAPQINLPFKREYDLIYSYYIIDRSEIFDFDDDPRKTAICKVCDDKIDIVCGSNMGSSYTILLTNHLRKHGKEFQEYLVEYSLLMKPDTKNIHEHFDKMTSPKISFDEKLSSLRVRECVRNRNLNKRNIAGVQYSPRDLCFYKGINIKLVKADNAKMLDFIHKYSNQNVNRIELMGTETMGANLLRNYKQSKCLVDNDGDIIMDLQRLLCKNMCFFDPKLYDNCSYDHDGDISLFSKSTYLASFEGFKEEIEKYPEMQLEKDFNVELLKQTNQIEKNKNSIMEMNRMLKIIVSLITVVKDTIESKIKDVISKHTQNNLVKPDLAIHGWGPKIVDIDVANSEDDSQHFSEDKFSTFKHLDQHDCPAYEDESKKEHFSPFEKNGSYYYPCDVGGCAIPCSCPPCQNPELAIKCPEHAPDHPALFDTASAILIRRRILFESEKPIFRRPEHHPSLCPPPLKLANLSKLCSICLRNVDIHSQNHLTLHVSTCEICEYIDFISKNSYNLICFVCLKKFQRKYELENHLKKHSTNNPYYCDECDIGFSSRFNFERHLEEYHTKVDQTYSCEHCDLTFIAQRNLETHRKEKHEDVKLFECDLCEKSYPQKRSLTRHQRISHNIDNKKVSLPGTGPRNKNILDCDLCDSRFTQKSDLDRHLQTVHSGPHSENTFTCKICHKNFQRKDKLIRHEQVHNETKIICEICLTRFQNKNDLRIHRIANHENK